MDHSQSRTPPESEPLNWWREIVINVKIGIFVGLVVSLTARGCACLRDLKEPKPIEIRRGHVRVVPVSKQEFKHDR